MFFILSKTLDLAVAPLTWVLVLIAVALRASARGRRRVALACLGSSVAVVLALANPMVSNRLWWWLESGAVSTRKEGSYDAVILLGGILPHGTIRQGDAPSYGDGVERLLTTYDLLRAGDAKIAIVSGGIASPRPDDAVEATVLGDQLVRWGIPPDRLVIDVAALNTRQNAVEAARIANERQLHRLLVVTSAFHMPRAAGCFRAVDLEVDLLPVDHRAVEPSRHPWQLAPRAEALGESTEALREWTGRATYRILGYSR